MAYLGLFDALNKPYITKSLEANDNHDIIKRLDFAMFYRQK